MIKWGFSGPDNSAFLLQEATNYPHYYLSIPFVPLILIDK